jgi:hypothetical protein
VSANLKMATELPPLFAEFCAKVGVQPTSRQLRAWFRGDGTAHAAALREAGHNRKVRAELIAQGAWK